MSNHLAIVVHTAPRPPLSQRPAEMCEHKGIGIFGAISTGAQNVRVKQTLLENRDSLESLAKLLLEKEVVDRATLDELLSKKAPLRKVADTGIHATDGGQKQ